MIFIKFEICKNFFYSICIFFVFFFYKMILECYELGISYVLLMIGFIEDFNILFGNLFGNRFMVSLIILW